MEPSASVDLSILTALDALLQEGSVSRAARRMGLSTPAMSHTLARIREQLGDPILVRAGRGMVLTPHAEAIRPRVHTVVAEARQALARKAAFVASELEQTFVVHCSDYALTILGREVDLSLSRAAPGVCVHFAPGGPDDPARLRRGDSDVAVGSYRSLPTELRCRQLLTDRPVCAVRAQHPEVNEQLSMEQFVRLAHIHITPRGERSDGIDDALRRRGHTRTVARAVPCLVPALQLAAQTDYIVTIPERVALALARRYQLKLVPPPLELDHYALSLVWHPRFDDDAGHRFLRQVLVHAAEALAAQPREGTDAGPRYSA